MGPTRFNFWCFAFLGLWLVGANSQLDLLFGVVVDGGSTGSRIHIFQFKYDPNGCGGEGSVVITLPERSKKITPGIADIFRGHTGETIESHFAQLREFLVEVVPQEQLSDTPVVFRGTGGIRSLDSDDQKKVVSQIQEILPTWKAAYHQDWAANVLDGTSEGVYGWVQLNQLLRRFPDDLSFIEMTNTTGIESCPVAAATTSDGSAMLLEMGGASVQIVVEPPEDIKPMLQIKMALVTSIENKHENGSAENLRRMPYDPRYASLRMCGKETILYAESIDGLGRQLALHRYFTHASNLLEDKNQQVPLACLPRNASLLMSNAEEMLQPAPPPGTDQQKTFANEQRIAVGLGSDRQCMEDVNRYCFSSEAPSASSNSTEPTTTTTPFPAAPTLPFAVGEDIDIVATENFYYFNRYVNKAVEPAFAAADFRTRAAEVCPLDLQAVREAIDPEAAEEKVFTSCFGLNFISSFLLRVMGLEPNRKLLAASQVAEVDISWPAGFMMTEFPSILRSLQKYPHTKSSHFDEL